jgi:hypothetical protein
MKNIFWLALVLGSIAISSAEAAYPTCLDFDRRPLTVNNDEVLKWKENTPNQYKDRALVVGSLVKVLLDRKSHLHLEMDLTPEHGAEDRDDHVEIVYNKEFGSVGKIAPGQEIVACGDYITSVAQSGPFKPSPVGAIVHWVHASNNTERHVHGFLMIGGKMFGQEGSQDRLLTMFPEVPFSLGHAFFAQ